MADVLDYALQQGNDIGIYVAFILVFLIYLIPVGFVGYWAIKIVGYMVKNNKQGSIRKSTTKQSLCFKNILDSRNKRIAVWIIGILLCIYAAFKVCTYNISLSKIKDRNTESIELSQSLKGRIQKETQDMDKAAVIDYSVKLTAKLLTFSATQGKLGDNKKSKANCVGYARLCASICNYGFRQNHIQAKAKPVVGYVYLWNFNLCKLISHNTSGRLSLFTKDHDFVDIDGKFVDPCIYDILNVEAKQK